MFTGIIEELGTVKKIKATNNSMELTIYAPKILTAVNVGDSIAVNGVCLTVISYTSELFSVDIMPETFKATSLSKLAAGSFVNLERALRADSRLGGHFVTGHIDGTGIIQSIKSVDNAYYYTIKLSSSLLRYCINKGSIAVDGTSLTIFGVDENSILLSLIPHTIKHSVLGKKNVNDLVNIECDMLGKYVEHLLNLTNINDKSQLSKEFLLKHGFLDK